MSAYSDWKCGALSDEDYAFECWREDAMDKALEEKEWAAVCCDKEDKEKE